ncbi:MAG: branched-chain amino acid ABC transporter substrate-binding protein [Formosimonas sp.]
MKKCIFAGIVAFLYAGQTHAQSCTDNPSIKVGFAAPQFDFSGTNYNDGGGASLAFEEANQNGGVVINGKQRCFELILADDNADNQQGIEIAKSFVKSGVVAVIGHLNSGVSLAVNPIYAKNSIVQISPSSTNPSFTLREKPSGKTPDGYNSHYRVITHDGYVGSALARYVNINKAKSIAMFDNASEYGWIISSGIDNELDKLSNIRLVSRKIFAYDADFDFQKDLNEIKKYGVENNAIPEFIFWSGSVEQSVALARQIKAAGLNTKLTTTFDTCIDDFIAYAGDAANGVVCAREHLPTESIVGLNSFKEKYETWSRGNKAREYQLYTPYTYDAANAIIHAIQIAGSAEPKKIVAAMPKVNFKGVTGEINFDKNGDVNDGAVAIYEVVNGSYVFKKLFRTKTNDLAN